MMYTIKIFLTSYEEEPKNGIENEKLSDIIKHRINTRKSTIDKEDLDKIKHFCKPENDSTSGRQEIKNIIAKYLCDMRDFSVLRKIEKCTCGDMESHAKEALDAYVNRTDVVFKRMPSVDMYFANKLEDNKCILTKKDIEDLVSRAERVKADISLAESLLPTTDGVYDDNYILQVETIFAKLPYLYNIWTDKTTAWIEFEEIPQHPRTKPQQLPKRERPTKNINKTTQE